MKIENLINQQVQITILDYSFVCTLVDPTPLNGFFMIAPYTGIKYFQTASDIPSDRLQKAIELKASHSSSDGSVIYRKKMNVWEYSEWDLNNYGSWWVIDELPGGLCLI